MEEDYIVLSFFHPYTLSFIMIVRMGIIILSLGSVTFHPYIYKIFSFSS